MRKQILFLLGGVLIVAALVAVGWFLLTSPAPAAEDVEIEGCWKVCKENDVAVAQEYMIFTSEGTVTDYREGKKYFESEYTVEGQTLTVSALDRSFEVSVLSEHQLVLSGSDGSRRELIAVDGMEAYPTSDALLGSWSVVMQAGRAVTDERIIFTEDTVCDYRDGKEYLKSGYVYEAHLITVEKMNAVFEVYTAGEALLLYERNGDYVWELIREEG